MNIDVLFTSIQHFIHKNKALTEETDIYRRVKVTPEENEQFVRKFMPRIVLAISKLCEFVEENKR